VSDKENSFKLILSDQYPEYQKPWSEAVYDGAIICSLEEYIEDVFNGIYPSLDGIDYGYGGGRIMVRIDWRYTKERGDYKDDNSKNRGFSLVEVDTEYDVKTVLKEFYDSMKEPVQIINIRRETI